MPDLQDDPLAVLAAWPASQRLYTLSGGPLVDDLLVESFSLIDDIGQPYHLQLDVLGLDARLPLQPLLNQRVTLHTRLHDGSLQPRSGLISHIVRRNSDAGFQRFRLTVRPWVALLAHSSHSRAWQHKTLPQILQDLLAPYRPHAHWQLGELHPDGSREDLPAFLAQGPHAGEYDYCCQYRESDLAFLQRLLANAGLGWRIQESPDAPSGHSLIVFADSSRWPQNPHSARHAGLAYQPSLPDAPDTLQAFGVQHRLTPAASALLRWDPTQKRALATQQPPHPAFTPPALQDTAPWLQHHQPPTGAAFEHGHCTPAQLQHLARLAQQAHQHRAETWIARSTVRSLRAGQWFQLQPGPSGPAEPPHFTIHSLHALGLNNLPRELSQRLAPALAAAPAEPAWADPFAPAARGQPDPQAQLLHSLAQDPQLRQQAQQSGHANRFHASPRSTPWRPTPIAKPSARGLQSALVVGPHGNPQPQDGQELHTDALGRIQVQFHWQAAPHADPRPDNRSSCWVRVAQRWAGAGLGHQFIPRIGQEVLIHFLDHDIDRPICIGAVPNGRGEGGLPRTPGGQANSADPSPYTHSHDHRPSAQGNLVRAGPGGHAPAWHGGAPGPATPGAAAQNNRAALSGLKSQELGGCGFSQLVFDDTPGQLRVQFATTQHASQLNLGHLLHQADNHRGGHRGSGFELRSDAYGAIRARHGLLLSSYACGAAQPAGDNVAGLALLKQAFSLADRFSHAARTHQTTALASAQGAQRAGHSHLSERLAPLKALHQAVGGLVSADSHDAAVQDASRKNTQGDDKVPHSTDPLVALSAKAGLATVAGQDLQLASGEVISVQAGQDLQLSGGAQLRLHSGQSLGLLGGAVQAGPGEEGTGLGLTAAQGPVQLQAQAGPAQLAARGLVDVQSAHAEIDWAAATKITLAVAGGASLTLQASGITTQCPGKITVSAAQKRFIGPGHEDYAMPLMPKGTLQLKKQRPLSR